MTKLFGTNGIRWTVSEDKGAEFAIRLGLAIGTHFGKGSKLCLGMDTRTSSPLFFNAVSSGLQATGCDVIDLGIVPTPVVQYSTTKLGVDGGLMVTASHNPPEYNGLKCLARDGTEMSKEDELDIEEKFSTEDFHRVDWQGIGKMAHERAIQPGYIREIVEKSPLADGRELSIIVDCSNGTAAPFTPVILKDLGCKVSTMNAQPDGRFPGRLPEPTKKNIASLMTAVECEGADFGAAHDGDADRAIFVDEKGEYVTGDQSLAIFAIDAVKRSNGGNVVIPVNTSMMVFDVVVANGGKIEYTPIGSPLVARHMMKTNAILGGEGNGGVIFPEHLYCRDGMMTCVKMAQMLSREKRTLSEIVEELPKYHLMREKLPLPRGLSRDALMNAVKGKADGEIVDIDGIKILQDGQWVLVRFSGTEPILRITAETDSESKTAGILSDNKKWVQEIIDSLSS